MGYYDLISFKKIDDLNSLSSFFKVLKNTAVQKMLGMAEFAYCFDPLCCNRNFLTTDEYEDVAEKNKENYQKSIRWFFHIFTFRYAYVPDLGMIVMSGVPFELQNCFDGTVCFSDNGDVDHAKNYYDGIEKFEKIWTEWDKSSPMAIRTFASPNPLFDGYDLNDPKTIEKIKRILAYHEIFSFVEDFVLDRSSAVYFVLFNEKDRFFVNAFLKKSFESAKINYLEGK